MKKYYIAFSEFSIANFLIPSLSKNFNSNFSATLLAISFPPVPCSLEIEIINLLFIIFLSVFSSSIAIFSLYVFFNINIEIMQVAISAIGKVHQTILVTLSDNVNKYATGNTNFDFNTFSYNFCNIYYILICIKNYPFTRVV